MIYGANGYTGELIAKAAVKRGLRPILAGRSAAKLGLLVRELNLEARAFDLQNTAALAAKIGDVGLVLNCAGPFSSTAAALMKACLAARADYLDITGEIEVFEHAQTLNLSARSAGIVICPGVGFDVIPTDCVAAALKSAMPDAISLALGFDSSTGLSPGTAKTSIEGLSLGGKIRRDGRIESVPLAFKDRRIDFGDGEKLAMSIPWGDVSTAFATTGIPNIEVYIPATKIVIQLVRTANRLRWLIARPMMQRILKQWVEKTVRGPTEASRADRPTYVWGEVTNAHGDRLTARITTANGYSLTVTGALTVVEYLQAHRTEGGAYTPAKLMGADLISKLPGSGRLEIT